ncbi:MAG: MFS transporter [Acetobacteraceae bacterium]|nr:MFS transporter [Acetobacteraceae bacterium]
MAVVLCGNIVRMAFALVAALGAPTALVFDALSYLGPFLALAHLGRFYAPQAAAAGIAEPQPAGPAPGGAGNQGAASPARGRPDRPSLGDGQGGRERGGWAAALADMAEGFRFVARDRLLLVMAGVLLFPMLAVSPISALEPAFVERALRLGPQAFGYLDGALTVGLLAGGLLVGGLERRVDKVLAMWGGMAGMALATAGLAASPLLAWAVSANLALGFSITVSRVAYNTMIQTYVGRGYMGRTFGTVSLLGSLLSPPWTVAAGRICDLWGARQSLLIMAALAMTGAGLGRLAGRMYRAREGTCGAPQPPGCR